MLQLSLIGSLFNGILVVIFAPLMIVWVLFWLLLYFFFMCLPELIVLCGVLWIAEHFWGPQVLTAKMNQFDSWRKAVDKSSTEKFSEGFFTLMWLLPFVAAGSLISYLGLGPVFENIHNFFTDIMFTGLKFLGNFVF